MPELSKKLVLLSFILILALIGDCHAIQSMSSSLHMENLKFDLQSMGLQVDLVDPFQAKSDLLPEHFKILVNGREVSLKATQKLPTKDSVTPSQVALILDISKSVKQPAWLSAVEIADQIIRDLPPEFSIALVLAGEKVEYLSGFTDDREDLKSKVKNISPFSKKTLLNEAIFSAVEQLAAAAGEKKAIFLFTDGLDDGSYVTEDDCVDLLKRETIAVFSFDLGDRESKGSQYLRRLVAISRGGYSDRQTFDQIKASEWMRKPTRQTYHFLVTPDVFGNGGVHEITVALSPAAGSGVSTEISKIVHLPIRDGKPKVPIAENPVTSSDRDITDMFKENIKAFLENNFLVPRYLIWVPFILSLFLIVVAALVWDLRRRLKRTEVSSVPSEKPQATVELGNLREKTRRLMEDARGLEENLLEYGDMREEGIRRWRGLSFEVAKRAVSVLKTCWLEQEDPLGQIIYSELLGNLKAIGIEEINPRQGESVDINDHRYLVKKKEGIPPFMLRRVIYPGYYFRPRTTRVQEPKDEILLEPAHVEVAGKAD